MEFDLPQGSVVGPVMFCYYTYLPTRRYHWKTQPKMSHICRWYSTWVNMNKLLVKIIIPSLSLFLKSNLLYEPSLNVCGTIIKPLEAVRNLGFFLMHISSQISSASQSSNCPLRNIGRIIILKMTIAITMLFLWFQNLTIILMVTCSCVHLLMIIFLSLIELALHTHSGPGHRQKVPKP